MITDIHEKIKEKIREDINQPDTNNIIADFMKYSLPYRLEHDETGADKYNGDYPWSRIAQKIKENPNVLKAQDLAYIVSASFRSSTKIYARDEFSVAMEFMEKLKVLKDDGIISEAQFQEVIGMKSPETGETLLTRIMKDALNLERGNSNLQMLNRLFEVGVDVNIPNLREQYPIQIIQHYHNIRKKNIEYSIERGLVCRDFVNEDYTFPKEKHIVEERTSKETIEKIKNNMANKEAPKIKYKRTQKVRAFVTENKDDIATWREKCPQGYAYAINVIEPTYLSEDTWAVNTIILPGKYIVYEGNNEDQQVIAVEKFYNNEAYLYLIDEQCKKIKEINNKEVLKALAGGNLDKTLSAPAVSKITVAAPKIAAHVVKKIDKTMDIKTGLKQLESASDKIFKKITGKLFKK